MIEVVFPLLGTAFVVLVVLPLFAALARSFMAVLDWWLGPSLSRGVNLRFLVLVASTALPIAWFASAGVHQAERGQTVLGCLLERDAAALCFEPGLFALLLSAFLAWRLWSIAQGKRSPRVALSERREPVTLRCARLIAARPELRVLSGRLLVTTEPDFALGTCGWWRPRVYVADHFAALLSDEQLCAALAHEAEHVRMRDPLRYTLLRFAFAANPVGAWLLGPRARRWTLAREAECDRQAVLKGTAPLALAEAILVAARPQAVGVALGAHDHAALELRIKLLLAFSERHPETERTAPLSTFPVATALLIGALSLPHHAGTLPLDILHTGAEQTLGFLLP